MGRGAWENPEIEHRNEAGAGVLGGLPGGGGAGPELRHRRQGGGGFVDPHSSPGKGAGELRRELSGATVFDREDVVGIQGGSLPAPHERGLKRRGRLTETLIAEKSEERNMTAVTVLYGCHV